MIDEIKLLLKNSFQPKKIKSVFVLMILPSLLFYICSILIMQSSGFTIIEILRDTAQLTNHSSFLGFLSNIGVWLWVSALAICGFGVIYSKLTLKDYLFQLLILLGFLTAFLLVDDFFMIHDRYIDQRLCHLFYSIFLLVILLKYFRGIVEIDGFAFLLSGAFLSLSVLIDLTEDILPLQYQYSQIFEEGFKFLGITGWLYFCSRLSSHCLLNGLKLKK